MHQVYSANDLLNAGLAIVRDAGYEAVSMRSLAQAAGCSVQPLYSLFNDKESLMEALYAHALQWIRDYNVAHAQEGCNEFASVGRAHIRIAQREPRLFTFVYASPYSKAADMEKLFAIAEQPGVVERMTELFGIPEATARALYLDMVIYTHGLASFIVSGAHFSDAELEERMNTAFFAFAQKNGLEGKGGHR